MNALKSRPPDPEINWLMSRRCIPIEFLRSALVRLPSLDMSILLKTVFYLRIWFLSREKAQIRDTMVFWRGVMCWKFSMPDFKVDLVFILKCRSSFLIWNHWFERSCWAEGRLAGSFVRQILIISLQFYEKPFQHSPLKSNFYVQILLSSYSNVLPLKGYVPLISKYNITPVLQISHFES